jgi:CheY-like chemotaxis protein
MTRTLLIIDDNKSVRDSLRFLLQHRGYDVLVAENGPQGIAIAGQSHVDGALVDVNMPGMNGIEVCRLLLQQARTTGKDIAVWMMTGARTPAVEKLAAEAGALTLMAKPFDFSALYRRFEERWGKPQLRPAAPDVLDEL